MTSVLYLSQLVDVIVRSFEALSIVSVSYARLARSKGKTTVYYYAIASILELVRVHQLSCDKFNALPCGSCTVRSLTSLDY